MVNLEEFKYGGTNITAFRLLDPEREELKQVVQDWIDGEMRYSRSKDISNPFTKVSQCIWEPPLQIIIPFISHVVCQ